jgi:hypothetical protein
LSTSISLDMICICSAERNSILKVIISEILGSCRERHKAYLCRASVVYPIFKIAFQGLQLMKIHVVHIIRSVHVPAWMCSSLLINLVLIAQCYFYAAPP